MSFAHNLLLQHDIKIYQFDYSSRKLSTKILNILKITCLGKVNFNIRIF